MTGGRILGKTSIGRAAKTSCLGVKGKIFHSLVVLIIYLSVGVVCPIRKMYLRPLLCSSGVPSLRGEVAAPLAQILV